MTCIGRRRSCFGGALVVLDVDYSTAPEPVLCTRATRVLDIFPDEARRDEQAWIDRLLGYARGS